VSLIGVTGHQDIHGASAAWIEVRIREILLAHRDTGLVGIGALAAGADQLFARCVLDLGGSLEVVVPCAGYETAFGSVDDRRAYEAALAAATTVRRLPYPAPSQEAFMAAGEAVAQRCELLLAVWDGLPARGLGGTADVVRYARGIGRNVTIVWPAGAGRT
jgi:hypothetical protein